MSVSDHVFVFRVCRPRALLASLALFLPLMLASATILSGAELLAPAALTTEYAANPVGIDAAQPRLSWQLRSSIRGAVQSAYQIQVARSAEALARGEVLWDSGRVESANSVKVPYAGPALVSAQRCVWRVRTWDRKGEPSPWSGDASWEMGLLAPADWTASWITPDRAEPADQSTTPPVLRRSFVLDGNVREARLYISSLGLYEAELNGRRVGDQVLTPGWTSYDRRLQYQTYDVTGLLRAGENVVGVTLADGWFRGPMTWDMKRNNYGPHVALLAQLRITYADGRVEVVGTDPAWKSSTGPIRMSEIYAGEQYDARRELRGWSQPGFDDREWSAVRLLEHRKDMLVAPPGPPIRCLDELKPVAILRTPAGETVADLGQNMVGHVRLRVKGPAGTRVTLRHVEVLDKAGNAYTANLRGAAQRIEYTLRGEGEEVYEPRFTFQGFRYVVVEGYPGEVTPASVTGVVVHSDLPRTGEWESSNPLLNRLQHNIVWGQKGNFVGVPTDCPQRDERLGWTGDAQAFIRTASFNMNVAGFFTNWLRDLAADQKENGAVPIVIPDLLTRGKPSDSSAGWGDVATIAPWTLYLVYGDRRVLETQYASMRAWVEFIRSRSPDDLWTTGYHFGDWLSYATTSPDYPGATTSKPLIATAFYAHSAHLLAKVATVLGRTDDARRYNELFERIKTAFNREFVTPSGRVGEATQTAYVLALQFELLPEPLREGAARRLAADVKQFQNHLTTGFLGTPYLCHVLSEHGQLDTAYALLNQDTYPSWLYPVKQGATTIWERWDGIKPDGSFQDAGMNSFNHYAYGAIGDWMVRVVAGLDVDPAEPGYRHVLIQPQPGGGLTAVRARLETQYGPVGSAWTMADGRFELVATVPPNTHATVRLPHARDIDAVSESGKPLREAPGVTGTRTDAGTVIVDIGSGEYRFSYAWEAGGK